MSTGDPISARIDALKGSRRLWTFVAILSFGGFFEIYDIALTAPLSVGLVQAGVFYAGKGGMFGLADQASFIAATFLGLYLGTVGLSGLADRFGRRVIFTWSLLWYSVATIVMGFQSSALLIYLWRLIAGVGLGVELVAIDCYIAEMMPARLRGRAFALATSIQFLAAPVVAILAWLLIPSEILSVAGWRWLCFIPAIGAVLIWFVRRGLPESPRWLAARGRHAEANTILSLLDGGLAATQAANRSAGVCVAVPRGAFSDLWRGEIGRRTILMMVFHVFQVIGFFGFSNWLPTLLVAKGITITNSLGYGIAIAFAAPLAPLVFLVFADKLERKWQIVAGAVCVAAFGLWFAQLGRASSAEAFIALGVGVAVSNMLVSYAYHTYQSEIFPVRIRARAIGFVYSFSRLSVVVSSYLIAFVLVHFGTNGVLALISSAMAVVAVTIGVWGPRTRLAADSIV
jgi:putative MFS transporter